MDWLAKDVKANTRQPWKVLIVDDEEVYKISNKTFRIYGSRA